MDEEIFDNKVQEFFEKDELQARISRAVLSFETRITIDHLLNRTGAKLVNQQGRSIDVHPHTLIRYWEVQSLIFNYVKTYGTNQAFEDIKDKWTTPARSRYY